MSDSDNTQLPIDTPQEEERKLHMKSQMKRKLLFLRLNVKPKESQKEPKKKRNEIVISLRPLNMLMFNSL